MSRLDRVLPAFLFLIPMALVVFMMVMARGLDIAWLVYGLGTVGILCGLEPLVASIRDPGWVYR